MKKSKVILGTLVGISAATVITGVVAGSIYASKLGPQQTKPNDISGPVEFDGRNFADYESAYEYAMDSVSSEEFNLGNKKFFSLTVNNQTHVFENTNELNDFISSQITTISNATTNNLDHNLDPTDNSIPINEMHKYNINTVTDTTFTDSTTNIYKRSDGTYTVGSQTNSYLDSEAEKQAKESYLEIHRAYNFNGVYFKNKSDLEHYLREVYGEQILKNVSAANNGLGVSNSNNYKKIVIKDINGNETAVSEPIYFGGKNTSDHVTNFLTPNAYKYLKISGTNGKDSYLKYNKNTNEIEGVLGESISMKDLPVLKKPSTDNQNLYIVDANVNEKYNLFGPYFLKTDGNITNITNPELWTETSDTPEQIMRSQAIDVFAGWLDLILLDPDASSEYKRTRSGEIRRVWDRNTSDLFYLTKLSKESKNEEDKLLYYKEQAMLDAIENIKTSRTRTLYDDFKKMYNNLINTKSHSTVYAIPTIYNYLTDQMILCQASVESVIAVREYFDVLCNEIQGILESCFGDLLYSYQSVKPNAKNKEEAKPKKFNFAEYFQINQYGTNGANLNGILNGYELINKYKGLIAGCYVFIQAIGNSQSNTQRTTDVSEHQYDISKDDHLFQLLEDGKHEDQESASDIKANWSTEKIGIGGTPNDDRLTVIQALNKLYDTYLTWAKLSNDEVDKILENNKDTISSHSTIVGKVDEIDRLLKSGTLANSIDKIANQFVGSYLEDLNDMLKPDEKEVTTTRIFQNTMKATLTQHTKASIELKTKAVSNYKSMKTNVGVSSWTSSGGLLAGVSIEEIETKDKIEQELSVEIEQENYYEFVQDSTAIETVSETKTDKPTKTEIALDVAGSLIENGVDIATTVFNMVNDLQNPFFEEVSGQIIAAGVTNIMSSVCNFISDVTPPPVNLIAKAMAFVFSFISAGIGTAEQVIYEYQVNDSQKTKYYWDGGLVMNRFWGLWRDEQRGIQDLKMQAPIEVIDSSNSDIIYFNKEIYTDDDDDIVRKEAMKYILDNNLVTNNANNKYSWVYSCEPNVNKLNATNSFSSIEELATNIVQTGSHTKGLNGEFFVNGMKFETYDDFISTFQEQIIDKIQPIYIAKIPELDANGYPTRKQTPAHLPYPFYEPYNAKNANLIIGANQDFSEYKTFDAFNWRNTQITKEISISQDQEYIIYNQNVNNESNRNINPTQYIKERFYQSFNVESKSVLKSYLHSSNHIKFDYFSAQAYTLNIYLVQLVPGVKKYFINRNDAVEYIIKTASNNGDLTLGLQSNKLLTYVNANGEKLYFNNQDQFNKWFLQNLTPIGGK